jgi:hypothetical protein
MTNLQNLERAAELVAEALKLIDSKSQYYTIRQTLILAFEEIDAQIDYEDERIAHLDN